MTNIDDNNGIHFRWFSDLQLVGGENNDLYRKRTRVDDYSTYSFHSLSVSAHILIQIDLLMCCAALKLNWAY